MLEEGPVSGDKWAIKLYGERQERGIVEGELKLFTEAGGPFEQRCGGRGNGKWQGLEIRKGLGQAGGVKASL